MGYENISKLELGFLLNTWLKEKYYMDHHARTKEFNGMRQNMFQVHHVLVMIYQDIYIYTRTCVYYSKIRSKKYTNDMYQTQQSIDVRIAILG